jgi:hypothetical protein
VSVFSLILQVKPLSVVSVGTIRVFMISIL